MSRLRRQGAWAVADQVLSSLTNFVPALLVARVLGPARYGTFSLVFLAWFGCLAIIRSAVMQPYTLAAAHLEGEAWRDVTRRAGGAAIFAGVVCGAGFAAAAKFAGISSDLGHSLLVIALLAPWLVLQEFWRVASFAASRAKTATANDLCWALGQIVAFAYLLTFDKVTGAESLLAWGLPAVVAAAYGVRQLEVWPALDLSAIRWAREWARLGAWFTAESATFSLGMFGVALIVAAEAGNVALGLLRAVQSMFGPIQLLTTGAGSAFMPYLVRLVKRERASGVSQSLRFAMLMAAAVAVYGAFLVAAGHLILTKGFGPAYGAAEFLVVPVCASYILFAFESGAQQLLQAREQGARLLTAQLAASISKLAAVAVLGSVAGLRGAAWGVVVGSGVGALVCWTQVARTTTRESSERAYGTSERKRALPVPDPS